MDREAAATHTDNINLFGKVSITSAFTPEGRVYKKELVEYLSTTRDLTVEKIGGISGVEVMIPEATYLVWCDFRKLGSWPKVMRRLKEGAGVALSGGEFFGPAGAGWFRINTAYPVNILNSALDQIADEFKGK
ncbi:MAG: aminotransferase class I/II-fold pyridoxal phosphate-dependent enzyme, partial [Deltaproteobacteria bacterium]|nr:aminotransferase class I/II-fold pyridoxal phosphate-dependent enzyme [Deltaproteobacteria bacterium]